jgi:taurine--2-oxoglutarate transaminase
MAKGLTSGYVPMGAVSVNDRVASYFEDKVLWAGLTYSAHALACAAAVANIEVYREEGLIENARQMGKVLRAGLMELAEKHPCVGDVRGVGLHQVLELVKNQETREPMSGFNEPPTEPMQKVAASLRQSGMSTFVRWNWIFNTPPLVINQAQIQEGLAMIDQALSIAEAYVVK